MSLIATATAASASPTVNLFTHGHKKGGHAGKDGTASSSTQGPATTQSLLSSLLESIEQVIGISLTAPQPVASTTAPAASATAPATGAVSAAAGSGVAPMPNASTSFSGIGAHINTKA